MSRDPISKTAATGLSSNNVFWQRTERGVYRVATHAHALSAVARITQRMWHTLTLRGHFGQGGFCSFFFCGAASQRKMAMVEHGSR